MSIGNTSELARITSDAPPDKTPPGAPTFAYTPRPDGNDFVCGITHDPLAIQNTPLEDGLRNGVVAVALELPDGTDPLAAYTDAPSLLASGVKMTKYALTDADSGQTSEVRVPQLKKGARHVFAAFDCDGDLS